MQASEFQRAILTWYQQYGRHDLPWQQAVTPYRVWVSEIMLQQTQVATVIPYFEKFSQRFPTVATLAAAEIDEVLQYWAGLGYYARARNLHRTSQLIVETYGGTFPANVDELQALPGIGRSTAGAILALAFGQRAAILDGNVKRVLTRVHKISGWPGNPRVLNKLWQLAEQYTPTQFVAEYTQAMMDLGATICTRSQAKCTSCPVAAQCLARKHGDESHYPEKKPVKILPIRHTHLLVMQSPVDEILLYRRPPAGVWGGLWSLPECNDISEIMGLCLTKYGATVEQIKIGSTFRHTFSHYHLDIVPVYLQITKTQGIIQEGEAWQWHPPAQALRLGIPKPVKDIINNLRITQYGT